MQPDEDFLVSFRDAYVFSCAISLFINISLQRGAWLLVGSQKTAEAVAARSAVVNTQLKQDVNERVSRR